MIKIKKSIENIKKNSINMYMYMYSVLDEDRYDGENYQGQGLCLALANSTNRGLDNSCYMYHAKTKIQLKILFY